MVSPVSMSSVRFCANNQTDTESILSRPGAYSKQETEAANENVAPEQPKKKKMGTAAKVALWTIGTAAVVTAGLGALSHFKVLNKLAADELASAGILKKVPHYLAVAGEAIANTAGSCLTKVKGWLHIGGGAASA